MEWLMIFVRDTTIVFLIGRVQFQVVHDITNARASCILVQIQQSCGTKKSVSTDILIVLSVFVYRCKDDDR